MSSRIPAEASARAFDKIRAKRLFRRAGLPLAWHEEVRTRVRVGDIVILTWSRV